MDLPLNIDFMQVLLHMLNFVILAGGLSLLLFKPVNKFLDERKAHYEDLEKKNRDDAEKNASLKAEYEQKLADAEQEIAEKREKAEKEMTDAAKLCISEAKEKANLIISAAESEAETRKEHILDSAQTEIGELVISATQKLLSDTVTPERNSALYDEFIRLADETVEAKRGGK